MKKKKRKCNANPKLSFRVWLYFKLHQKRQKKVHEVNNLCDRLGVDREHTTAVNGWKCNWHAAAVGWLVECIIKSIADLNKTKVCDCTELVLKSHPYKVKWGNSIETALSMLDSSVVYFIWNYDSYVSFACALYKISQQCYYQPLVCNSDSTREWRGVGGPGVAK